MIEVEVHQQLHAFLRAQGETHWPHHLTIARLVARALRLQRSALIQVSASAKFQGQYRLSYLVPLMLCPDPVILVAPEPVQHRLLQTEIPRLSEWMQLQKTNSCWGGLAQCSLCWGPVAIAPGMVTRPPPSAPASSPRDAHTP